MRDMPIYIMILKLSNTVGTVNQAAVNLLKISEKITSLRCLQSVPPRDKKPSSSLPPTKATLLSRSRASSQLLSCLVSGCYNCRTLPEHKTHFISCIIQNGSEILLGKRSKSNRPAIQSCLGGRRERYWEEEADDMIFLSTGLFQVRKLMRFAQRKIYCL